MDKEKKKMSPALLSMWISISAIGLLALAAIFIYISRNKLKNSILKLITALIAYVCLIVGGIIIFFIVVGGPTE